MAGRVQVVGWSLEVAPHKLHELGFSLKNVKDGFASAPICPPHSHFIRTMRRTNDAILFGGDVHLLVTGDDNESEELAGHLPSGSPKDYGKPFAQVFTEGGSMRSFLSNLLYKYLNPMEGL